MHFNASFKPDWKKERLGGQRENERQLEGMEVNRRQRANWKAI